MDRELSLLVPTDANTSTVSISTTSAQSAVIPQGGSVVVHSTADCFVIQGANPTAVANTCLPLFANVQYRLSGIRENGRLAFITASGTGTVYITPGA